MMGKKVKLRKDEAGYALALVLILLILVGLIIGPLLLLMTTSLMSSQRHEEWMLSFYAADAGIEDGAYKIQNDDANLPEDVGDSWPYTIADVNGYQVDVTIENYWILTGLETPLHGTTPHSELVTVGQITEFDEEAGTATFWIEFSYDGSFGELHVDRVGAWLPSGFSYVPNSSGGITSHEDVPDNPTQSEFHGGTALVWDFTPSQGIKFEELPALEPPGGGLQPGAEFPMKRILYFEFTPAEDPTGAFSWLRTKQHDIYLSWDVASGFYKITSTAGGTTIESYIARAKLHERVTQVYGDYRAIGNSLMYASESGGYRDTLLEESSATITKSASPEGLEMPADAKVEAAYLYWAAWWTEEDLEKADREVTLQVDDEDSENITASKWSVLEHPFLPHDDVPPGKVWHAYACFADVTDKVQEISTPGNATYTITVGDLDADVVAPYPDGHVGPVPWSYAGWSLIIIYSSAEEEAHQLYIYDQFGHAHDSCDDGCDHPALHYGMEGFLAPSGAEGYLSYFVGEGDEHLTNDYVQFKGESDTEWHYLYGGVNPQFNVMNGLSSGLDGAEIDGVDIETFQVSGPSPDDPHYLSEGDTSAELKITTRDDGWDLVYIIVSFRSDIVIESGLFPVGIVTYTYGTE